LTFVDDRPGHDRRYAIDSTRLTGDLGWRPQRDFSTALDFTLGWYLEHMTRIWQL